MGRFEAGKVRRKRMAALAMGPANPQIRHGGLRLRLHAARLVSDGVKRVWIVARQDDGDAETTSGEDQRSGWTRGPDEDTPREGVTAESLGCLGLVASAIAALTGDGPKAALDLRPTRSTAGSGPGWADGGSDSRACVVGGGWRIWGSRLDEERREVRGRRFT